jgi:hypothetical protein
MTEVSIAVDLLKTDALLRRWVTMRALDLIDQRAGQD